MCADEFCWRGQLFEEISGYAPARRSLLRFVDALGAKARGFLESLPAPENDGDTLVVEVDCKGAPMVTAPELARRRSKHRKARKNRRHHRRDQRRRLERVRRQPGKKSKNAKMATVGVIYTLRKTSGGMEGPINKQVFSTFEGMEALFIILRRAAVKRGYGILPTIFLADGQDHLWRLQENYFPKAEVCMDWWHIVEKFLEVGACLWGAQTPRVKAFVAHCSWELRHGTAVQVVAHLQQLLTKTAKTGPGNRGRRDALQSLIDHLTKNLARLNHKSFRDRDLPMSTGVVEGAVRHLVGVRLDGPGMRWSTQRAEALLQMRCILINGLWNDFAKAVSSGDTLDLLAQPVMTTPHYATKKVAA